jgi:hypothetical protein
MTTPELKPCPFCGSLAGVKQLKQSASARYYVCCFNGKGRCIASEHNYFGHFYVNRDDAVNAWNRRANNDTTGSSNPTA